MSVTCSFFLHECFYGFEISKLQAVQIFRCYHTAVAIDQIDINRQGVFPFKRTRFLAPCTECNSGKYQQENKDADDLKHEYASRYEVMAAIEKW